MRERQPAQVPAAHRPPRGSQRPTSARSSQHDTSLAAPGAGAGPGLSGDCQRTSAAHDESELRLIILIMSFGDSSVASKSLF